MVKVSKTSANKLYKHVLQGSERLVSKIYAHQFSSNPNLLHLTNEEIEKLAYLKARHGNQFSNFIPRKHRSLTTYLI